MKANTKKPVIPSHGACKFALPWARSSPRDGEPGGRPNPRKSSEVSVVIDPLSMNGRKRQRRNHGVGQNVAHHDRGVADAKRTGSPYIVEITRTQKFGAHDAHQRHPAEHQHQA